MFSINRSTVHFKLIFFLNRYYVLLIPNRFLTFVPEFVLKFYNNMFLKKRSMLI